MKKKIIYTKEKIQEAVKNSNCYADVCRYLGAKTSGNSYQNIRKKIVEYNLNTDHFLNPKLAGFIKSKIWKKKHYSEILIKGHKNRINSQRIRKALIESGEPYICKICNMGPKWQGKELTLHVDHIDGNPYNSIKENLRFLCPNCHCQTETFGNRGKKCKNCNKKITSKSKYCKQCHVFFRQSSRKVKNRPSLTTLLKEVDKIGYVGTGKKYGVSDNTIRKWIKFEKRKIKEIK